MVLDVEYTDYHPTAFFSPDWCKGILVFNTAIRKEVYCHRISYGHIRRPKAVGIWHITYKQ